MEEYTQITIDMWMRWKEDIRRKLAETAGNFVYIGFRLRQIQNSGMFGGAADIFEFAQKEYGLGKSTVSRFIAINEKYSEGGYSLELKKEYQGFSSSKLAEMLTLPDSEVELITEQTTIREIRELKKFDAQDPEAVQAAEDDSAGSRREEERYAPLDKCIIDYFKDKRDVLNGVMNLLLAANESDDPDKIIKKCVELIVPGGQASHKKGIAFLFLYDLNRGVKYKLMMEPEPHSMTWGEFLDKITDIYIDSWGRDTWKEFYQAEQDAAEMQQDAENAADPAAGAAEVVATSQQEEPEEVAEPEDVTETEAGEPEESGEDESRESQAGQQTQEKEPEPEAEQEQEPEQASPAPAAGESGRRPIELGYEEEPQVNEELLREWNGAWMRLNDMMTTMRTTRASAECAHIIHDGAMEVAARMERILGGEFGELPD